MFKSDASRAAIPRSRNWQKTWFKRGNVMQWVFFIVLICFSAIQSAVLRSFTLKKEKVAMRSAAESYIFLWLVIIATFVFGFKMPYFAFIFLMISFLIHSYFGYYLNRFNKSKKFDRGAHGFGAFATAIFAYYFLSNLLTYGGSKLFQAVYVLLLGIAIGSIYELIEFCIDKKHKDKLQRGLKDTDMDMLANTVGSVIAAILMLIVL